MLAQSGHEALQIVCAGALLCMLILLAVTWKYIVLYMRARAAGAPVKLRDIALMLLHGVDPVMVVSSYIEAVQGGVSVTLRDLETHSLGRGDVPAVVAALAAAREAGLPLDFVYACAIDLAGLDVLEAVRTGQDPRVYDCPDPESGYDAIRARAGDGTDLEARARMTVHTNLIGLVGGVKEPELVERLRDAIEEIIWNAEDHEALLRNPDALADDLVAMELDADSAFDLEALELRIQRA